MSNIQPQSTDISKVINADILNVGLFKEEFIDLSVTSPPYNVDMPYSSNDDALRL